MELYSNKSGGLYMSTYKTVNFTDSIPLKISTFSNEILESHWHTQHEILFVLGGNVTIIENGKRIQLKKEDVYLFNSFSSHEIFASKAEVFSFFMYLLQFS